MRFKKCKEKHTNKIYWAAGVVTGGQMTDDIWWIIIPRGAGFDLRRRIGLGNASEKICHVKKISSAKKIAKLIQNG